MNYAFIEYEVESLVCTIRLNRPDVLNSFHSAMAAEVQDALDKASHAPEVRAVLLTANGRGFCAGQDLAEAIDPNGPDIQTIVEATYNPIIQKIRNLTKPVVCAVNGVAAGAGANIAFACDITIASTQAKFIQSFTHIGLIPDSGGTWFLPRLIGMQRATALAMLGDKLSAEEAKSFGLIWDTAEPEELHERAKQICARLNQLPLVGLGLTKKAFLMGQEQSLEQQLRTEALLQAQAAQSNDHKEGVQAFLEKRTPKFTGN
jgi:2-(1,2-epoxy-1,2-dihydrophenyl)acetyl-CoA isomerase